MPNRILASALARAFLAGEQKLDEIIDRGSQTLGRNWRWLRPLARRYVASLAGKIHPRQRDVARLILRDSAFERALVRHSEELTVAHYMAEPQRMQPVPAAQKWELPAIESLGALADWLWLEYGDLDWFADLKGLGYKSQNARLAHYHYRIWRKRSGGIRLIEAPKRRLKKVQREILAGILEKIPPHAAAHGFIKGRSIKTFVAPHVGRRIVLRMDLLEFFVSLSGARVQTVFRMLGYPERVADALGGICTNAVPQDVWSHAEIDVDSRELREARSRYARPHLPQGAPTSPALANICAFRIDCRLSGLAKSIGAQYTRYADDLAFSGDAKFEKVVERFATSVAAILLEEGFRANHHKTRILRQGVRQQLAGLVVNQRANLIRTDFDRLKAILTNCARFGPESQNRDRHPAFRSHLEGRVAFVEMVNAAKGKRLRAIFEQIDW